MTRTKCLVLGIICCLVITLLISLYPLQQDIKPCTCKDALHQCNSQIHKDTILKLLGNTSGEKVLSDFIVGKTEHDPTRKVVEGHTHGDNKDWGPHKMAIIVPLRDRLEELLTFVPYMHNFLNKQNTRHEFYVMNQGDFLRFNRASLINVGFLESRSDCDYIAMHDVDLIPVNPNITYPYPENGPYHVAAPELHPLYHYSKFVGGILLLTRDQFLLVNGMSNKYWGWGREDDEFYVRMKIAGLKVHRPKNITTGYNTFQHIHDKRKRRRDQIRIFDQKMKTSKLDRQTGVNTVKYKIDKRSILTLDGVQVHMLNVLLDCDVKFTPWCLPLELVKEYESKGLL